MKTGTTIFVFEVDFVPLGSLFSVLILWCVLLENVGLESV